MAKTSKVSQTAVVEPILTVRAYIGSTDQPLRDLFIAFKLSKPAGDSKAEKVAHIVETPRKIDPPKNASEQKRYQRILDQYNSQAAETVADPADEYVLGITDVDGYLEPVYDSSNPWRDRLARLEPDSFKFAVGEKYSALFIRHPSADLARALTHALNNKPSGRADVDFKADGAASVWGDGLPTLQTFTVEQGSGKQGEQFIIRLPDTPAAYVPLRSDGKDKWWLYAGMPHAPVKTVQDQVVEFTNTMGTLRYPASSIQESPFEEVNKKFLENPYFHGGLQAATGRFQEHLEEGVAFKPAAWKQAQNVNSWSAEIGESVTEDVEQTVPVMEKWGVVGPATAGAAATWKKNQWLKPPEHLLTIRPKSMVLMLARGAFAFNAWSELAKVFGCEYGMKSGHSFRNVAAEGGGGAIKNSIHKTGLASDMTGGRRRTTTEDWPVRFEAEFRRTKPYSVEELKNSLKEKQAKLDALVAQREQDRSNAGQELAAATEAKETLTGPGNGQKPTKGQLQAADHRIAKAQKAVDGVDKKYGGKIDKATKDRDAAQKRLHEEQNAVLSDSSRLPDHWSMRFRVYGHSSLDVFSENPETRKNVLAKLREDIRNWAGSADTNAVDGTFIQFLKDEYFGGNSSPAIDDWLRDKLNATYNLKVPSTREFFQKLANLSDDDLVSHYFRPTISQWRVNFYERDGGTDMPPEKPNNGDADFPTREWAKSWLNLTALGHGCLMHRIPPHGWDVRDKSVSKKRPDKVPPMLFPMTKYLEFEKKPAEAEDIVAAIEDITADTKVAPEQAEGGFEIEFHVPKSPGKQTDPVASVQAKDIDSAFFKEWRRHVSALGPPAYAAGSKAVFAPAGAEITVVLNELADDREAALKKAVDLFGSTFPDKKFVLLKSGSMVESDLPTGTALTGAELAGKLKTVMARLKTDSTVETKEAESAGGKKPDSNRRKPPKPRKKKEAEALPATKFEDWSILIQPVFANNPNDPNDPLFRRDQIVVLPARENAAHLEWWHFQHHSVADAGSWGKLVEECGYSKKVLSIPEEGALAASAEPVHFGLGYPEGDEGLGSTPWPNVAEIKDPPPNMDTDRQESLADPALAD